MVDRTAAPSSERPGSDRSGRRRAPDHTGGTEAGSGLPPVDLLAAEQAAADYWRQVATQRRVDAARVQRRPIVRAAIAVDRRTGHLQAGVAGAVSQVLTRARRVGVVAAGLGRRPGISRRRQHLRDGLAAVPAPGAEDGRSVLVLHLGVAPEVGSVSASLAPIRHASGTGSTADLLQQIDQKVQQSTASLVCLVGPDVRPVSTDWLARLVATVTGDVAAAAPLVISDAGTWSSATAVDLLVASAGLGIELDPERGPVPVARRAGQVPVLTAAPHDVVAVTAAAVVVDRRAWSAAGGITGADSTDTGDGLDERVVDLCLRLHAGGGRTRVVPAAVVVEARRIGRRREVREPIDVTGGPWRHVVEAQGPALVGAARSLGARDRAHRPTVAISTATPSRKLSSRSGDWHFAGDLAGALDRAGYDVRVQSAEEVDSLAGRSCELHLVLRGLQPVRRTVGQRHVLWVISHPEAVTVAECDRADLVLVASERFADHLASRTATPVEVLWQATEPRRFEPRPSSERHRHPITVVANTRGVPRRSVTDALAAGLEPAIYGQGWDGLVDPRFVMADHVDPDELASVYSSADMILNDHWATMAHWGFVSNRIFDVLACGTPVVSDHLPEIGDLFGDLVPMWREPLELRTIVNQLLADRPAAAAMAADGRRLVLEQHTFDHRVAELDHLLARHGLAMKAQAPGDQTR